MMRQSTIAAILVSLTIFGCSGGNSVNPNGEGPAGRLYVLNQGDKTIYIFDTRTMTILDTVDTHIDLPHYIEFSADGQYYYVTTLETSGHFAKFNAATNEFIKSVAVPPAVMPSAIAITNDGQFGYISNFSTTTERSYIHKYDLSTLTWIKQLQAGATTHDLKITSDGSTIVACNRFSDDLTIINTIDDDVSVVGITDDENYPHEQMRYGPMGVIIDHRDSLALIACMDRNQIRYLDIARGEIVDSVEIPVTGQSSTAGPMLLAVSPDDEFAFVTTQMGNSLVVFRISTGEIMANIPLATALPFGISISDDGSRVYVACVGGAFPQDHGRVYVVDGNNFAKVDSVDVGNQSYGLIWHAD